MGRYFSNFEFIIIHCNFFSLHFPFPLDDVMCILAIVFNLLF
jgi:hypothetical protein